MHPFIATPDELRAAADGLTFEVRTDVDGDAWRPVTVDELIDVVYGHPGGRVAARLLIDCLEVGGRDLLLIDRDNPVDIRWACERDARTRSSEAARSSL